MPSVGDIVVIAILIVLISFCIRSLYKAKKKGGCCGNCSSCGGSCSCSTPRNSDEGTHK